MTSRITDLAAAAPLDNSELIEISQVSTVVAINAATISAAAADNSYNDSGNGFLAAGFAVGMRVKVSGFTGDVANNIFVATITDLTAAKMTIGGVDGDVIVDDAAGEAVNIAQWVSRRISIDDLPGGGGGGASSAPVQTEAGDYTLAPGDDGNYIRMTKATAKVVNIATNATTALPNDGEWHIRNVGANNLTITPAGGVTANVPSGGTLVMAPGMTVTLKRAGVDVFDILGQTVPA